MVKRLLLGTAAAIAVLVVAFGGADLVVHADGGGSISGIVYYETGLDGQRDFGDPGAPDQPLNLFGDKGEVVATAQSGADGSYRFDGLETEVSYQVTVTGRPCHVDTFYRHFETGGDPLDKVIDPALPTQGKT